MERKNGGKLWGYWLLFSAIVFSGLSHSNRYLKNKRKKYELAIQSSLTPEPKMIVAVDDDNNENNQQMSNTSSVNAYPVNTLKTDMNDEENNTIDIEMVPTASNPPTNELHEEK